MPVTLNANQVPGVQVYSGFLRLFEVWDPSGASPNGNAPVAKPFIQGESADLRRKLNFNATSHDLSSRYGAGIVAVAHGLGLSAGAGLTLNIAAGHALISGIVEVAAATTAVMFDNTTNHVWVTYAGAISVQNNVLTAPADPACYLGAVITAAGAISSVDTAGVVYARGGIMYRETADALTPNDTPTVTALYISKTAGGLYLWDGANYREFSGTAGTQEQIEDVVGALMVDSATIDFTYNDGAGTLTAAIDFTGFDTDQITEGVTNLFASEPNVYGHVANILVAGHGVDLVASGNPDYTVTIDVDESELDISLVGSGVLPVARGGTGLSAVGTANQLLTTNGAANAMEWKSISAYDINDLLNTQYITFADAGPLLQFDVRALTGVTAIKLLGDSSSTAATVYYGYESANALASGAVTGFSIGGTEGSEAATALGAIILQLGGGGHNGTALAGGKIVIYMRAEALWTGTSNPTYFQFQTTPNGSTTAATRLQITADGNIILGTQSALATTATDGFPYGRSMAGKPTGDPTNYTGQVPFVFDTANHVLWASFGGGTQWRRVGGMPAPVALSDGASIAWNSDDGDHLTVTLAGNRTMAADSGTPKDGQKVMFRIKQDATGSRTITWTTGSAGAFVGTTDVPLPTLTTTANYYDYIGFIYNSTSQRWVCAYVNKGQA